MELFQNDGHLTDRALAVLIRGEDPGPLGRLEIAEHLSFCDRCLRRYGDALAGTELMVPPRSCRRTVPARARRRTWGAALGRCATAAAAVAAALTIVWSGGLRPLPRPAEAERSAAVERLRSWPERCGDALDRAVSDLGGWIGGLDIPSR